MNIQPVSGSEYCTFYSTFALYSPKIQQVASLLSSLTSHSLSRPVQFLLAIRRSKPITDLTRQLQKAVHFSHSPPQCSTHSMLTAYSVTLLTHSRPYSTHCLTATTRSLPGQLPAPLQSLARNHSRLLPIHCGKVFTDPCCCRVLSTLLRLPFAIFGCFLALTQPSP